MHAEPRDRPRVTDTTSSSLSLLGMTTRRGNWVRLDFHCSIAQAWISRGSEPENPRALTLFKILLNILAHRGLQHHGGDIAVHTRTRVVPRSTRRTARAHWRRPSGSPRVTRAARLYRLAMRITDDLAGGHTRFSRGDLVRVRDELRTLATDAAAAGMLGDHGLTSRHAADRPVR